MSVMKASQCAALVRELRDRLGLSQEKLASKLGVSFRTVNRWENERAIPSPMAMMLIEQLLSTMGHPGRVLTERYFPETTPLRKRRDNGGNL